MTNDATARRAYEEDVRRRPNYPDGAPRKTWDELPTIARLSWGRNPTPRSYQTKEQQP
jgi:hypothetical protein